MLLLSLAARALVCSFLVVAAAVGARRLSNTLSRRSNASGEPTATPSVPVPSETLAEELPHGMFRVLLQHLLLPLSLGYGLCLSDRTNMAMAQLQMAGDLGLSQADFGAAASAFFLPYVALQVPANYFLSRVSAKRALAGYVMCWSSVSAMHTFLHSSGELVVLRLLLGIAEAGYYPGCLYVMARWFPSQVAGQAVALLFSISLVFSSVTLGSSGLIMDSLDGALGVRGWRWLFLIQSLPGIPIALSILAFVDDDPHDCEWLTPSQRMYLVDRFRGEARLGKLADSLIAQLRQLLLLPSTWVLGLQFFSGTVTSYVDAFYDAKLVNDLVGWNASAIGGVLLLVSIIRLALGPLVARWADGGGAERKVLAVWGLPIAKELGVVIVAVPLLIVNLNQSSGQGVGLVYFIFNFFVLVWIIKPAGVLWALHHRHQPSELLPISIALINTFGECGGMLGPFFFGLMHDLASLPCSDGSTCASRWGPGLVVLHASVLVLSTATGLAAISLGFARDVPFQGLPQSTDNPQPELHLSDSITATTHVIPAVRASLRMV